MPARVELLILFQVIGAALVSVCDIPFPGPSLSS
jgi:hypothetical protein